jgi:asparaginyl-tRNA synthetase
MINFLTLMHFIQTYPVPKKYHTPEYLRSIPHLRSRTPFNALLLQLRSDSISSISRFFEAQGFVQTHPPIITSSDCEGAGEVFTVATSPAEVDSTRQSFNNTNTTSFFNDPKYLTVSSQLHLEALAQSLTRVWTLSPTFRAERSDTARHLSEFYMLEAELAFTDSLSDITNLLESLLRNLAFNLSLSPVGRDLLSSQRYDDSGSPRPISQTSHLLSSRWTGLMAPAWPRITYDEAINLLKASTEPFIFPPTYGSGLQAEHERFIAEHVGKGSPVFVTDYPAAIKPFYMALSSSPPSSALAPSHSSSTPTPPPPATVANFDLLFPSVLEVAGGSLREHRYDALISSMRAHGLAKRRVVGPDGVHETRSHRTDDLGPLQWYADLRKWGSVPHGGFGLGFDRLLGYLAAVPNVREVVTFPRWAGRCDC